MGDSQYARRLSSPRLGMSERRMGRTRKVSFGWDVEGFASPRMGSLAMAVDIAVEEAMLLIEIEEDLRASCRNDEDEERGERVGNG